MSTESIILLSNISSEDTDSSYNYGDKKPGAGYHKLGDSLHTVIYDVTDFVGTIKIQGTLAEFPGSTDWVDVSNTEIGLLGDSTTWATAQTRSFYGNFMWIRAAYNLQNGIINSVRYNH